MGRPPQFARAIERPSPMIVDIAVVAAISVPTLLDAWWNEEGTRQADWRTYVIGAVSVLVLLGRRRWPLAVALACGLGLTGWYVMGHHGELLNLPTMVALYTVAVQGDRRRTLVVGLVAAAWSGILGFTSDDPAGARGGSPILEMLMPVVPLALGEATRIRRQLIAEHAERDAAAQAERDRETEHRIALERVRLARDFHDVVAHTLAAVNVQMGVAVAAFDSEPATARHALIQAKASSKEALAELRAAVAAMRDKSDAGPTMPAPRLAELELFATTARAAGIDVCIDNRLDGRPIPAGVELTGCRVVQEALTNVVRHSGATRVTVAIVDGNDRITIDVADDGDGARSSDPAGHGLVGMSERVEALGGRLHYGRRTGGGFGVHAELPVERAR